MTDNERAVLVGYFLQEIDDVLRLTSASLLSIFDRKTDSIYRLQHQGGLAFKCDDGMVKTMAARKIFLIDGQVKQHQDDMYHAEWIIWERINTHSKTNLHHTNHSI